MKIKDELKDPLCSGFFNGAAALLVFLASIPVNAWFQRQSYIGLSGWILQTSGSGLTQEAADKITGIQNGITVSFVSRLPFGLLMTAFVMFFLIPAVGSGSQGSWKDTWRRSCTILTVPILLLAISSLCMTVSFTAGVVFAVGALSACVASIIIEARKGKWNGWLVITWVTGFLLITAVMLTNNHVVTMFS